MLTLLNPHPSIHLIHTKKTENKIDFDELNSIIKDLSLKLKANNSYIHTLRKYQTNIISTYGNKEKCSFQKKLEFATQIVELLENCFEKELYKARLSLLKKPLI